MRPWIAMIGLGLPFFLVHFPGAARAGADIQYVDSSNTTGTSMAVVVGPTHLAHTAQLLPVDTQGRIVGKGQAAVQIEKVLENLETALKEAQSGFDRLIKINVYATGPHIVDEVKKAFAKKFAGKVKPAVSFVAGTLAHPDAWVALDAVAAANLDPGKEAVKRIRCAALPGTPRGSHVAIMPAGAKVYVAGQAEKGDLAQATRRTLESLRSTLTYLGLKDAHVVQLKAFVRPMSDIAEVEKETAKFFGAQTVPPLVFVEWSSTLPIEIELIAAAGASKDTDSERLDYLTPSGMQASPLYSRVTRINHGKTIYLSGLYGTNSQTAADQIEEIFASLEGLLKKTGSDFRHLAKATYYVSDDEASRKLNELRPKWYDPRRPPAASKAMVAGVGVAGKSITLDMIAVPSR